MGYSPRGCREPDMTEPLTLSNVIQKIWFKPLKTIKISSLELISTQKAWSTVYEQLHRDQSSSSAALVRTTRLACEDPLLTRTSASQLWAFSAHWVCGWAGLSEYF